MTRKDYRLIADAIKHARQTTLNQPLQIGAIERHSMERVAGFIADALNKSFVGFDHARFMEACGFKD